MFLFGGLARRAVGGAIRGIGAVSEAPTNASYARAVHDGRDPVVAKGKALRFKVGKQTVYRKSVGPAKRRNATPIWCGVS